MKKTLFVLLMAVSGYAFAQSTEEERVKKVAIDETDAYVRRDFQAWADCYVDAPTTTFIGTPNGNPGGLMASTDFQKVAQGMKNWMKASPQSEMQVLKRDNWIVRVNGTMAWVAYDQQNLMIKPERKINSKELKVLEKTDGGWKIAATSTVWDFKNADPPIPSKY